MLLSILVPMENRHAFHPWLAWNLRKQQNIDGAEILVCCPREEYDHFMIALVKIQDAIEGGTAALYIKHIPSAPGEGVAVKRNKLLDAARGDYIGWMDSDDWHAPDRFAVALERLRAPDRPRAVGFSGARYLDITNDGVRASGVIVPPWNAWCWCYLPVWRSPQVVPVTIVARRVDLDRTVLPRFDETKKHGSDTRWMGDLRRAHRIIPIFEEPPEPVRFFALYHGGNMSRHVGGFRYDRPLADLIELCGPGWNDTTTHLQQLYRRLEKQRKED